MKFKTVGRSLELQSLKATNLYAKPGEDEGRALIRKSWRCLNCTFLEELDGFSKIDTGFGVWWIRNEDWRCPEDEPKDEPFLTDGDLRYLPNVPYFPCTEFDKDNVRKSQIATMAMCLSCLGIRGIETYEDYLELLLKHGDGTYRAHHRATFAANGISAYFCSSIGSFEIQDSIDDGCPVAFQVPYKGSQRNPFGFNYLITIYGYSPTHWLCHDPCGRLDIVNGLWHTTVLEAGKEILYDRAESQDRFFRGGDASGVGWLNFREN